MTYTQIVFRFLLLTALLSNGFLFSQIKFRELTEYNASLYSREIQAATTTRSYIFLNDYWQVYKKDDDEKRSASVLVPGVYSGDADLVYEKEFTLPNDRRVVIINFGGIYPAADIFFNGNLVYKHRGGELPFSVEIAKDFRKPGAKNKLTVELLASHDSPFMMLQKRQYLAPELFPGIIREVTVELLPDVSISLTDVSSLRDSKSGTTSFKIQAKITNKDFLSSADTGSIYTAVLLLTDVTGKEYKTVLTDLEVKRGKERDVQFDFVFDASVVWSPDIPRTMSARLSLSSSAGEIDNQTLTLAPLSFSAGNDGMMLNGLPFTVRGVTYIPSLYNYGHTVSYERMRADLMMIKDLGFNTVRFTKILPHPYALRVCQEIGLIAFIDAPLQNIPSGMLENVSFIESARQLYTSIEKTYSIYMPAVAFGLGSSFHASLPETKRYLNTVSAAFKKSTGKAVYASFSSGMPGVDMGLDIYGYEFFNTFNSKILQDAATSVGRLKVITSEAGYFAHRGNVTGYTSGHSFDAQAKYFENFLNAQESLNNGGYILSTMFDYRSGLSVINAGNNPEKLLPLGFVSENRNNAGKERPVYRVLNALFHDQERVTIAAGEAETENQTVFILYGLLLAVLSGFLVKSGKRFREDSMRALMRPYNFFQDVRDQRLYSVTQSIMLGFIASGVYALLISTVLHSFRDSVFFDRTVQTIGSPGLLSLMSMLVWKPLYSVLFLTAFFFLTAFVVSVAVRVGAMFIQTRVFYSSCFHVTVWASFPLLLLIPPAVLLGRILEIPGAVLYVILGLVLFLVFTLMRLMKGMYVIYDLVPSRVYVYTVTVIGVCLGITALILQINHKTFDFLFTVLKGL